MWLETRTTIRRSEPSPPVRKTSPSASVSVFRGVSASLASWSFSISVQDSCFVVISSVRVTLKKGETVLICLLRERTAVFSHTLLCHAQFGDVYLRAGKTTTTHSYTHKHAVGVDVQTHTHTCITRKQL